MIENEKQYEKYLGELIKRMDLDPLVNTPDEARLLELVSVIKEYEDKHFFFEKATDEELQAFRKEQLHNK